MKKWLRVETVVVVFLLEVFGIAWGHLREGEKVPLAPLASVGKGETSAARDLSLAVPQFVNPFGDRNRGDGNSVPDREQIDGVFISEKGALVSSRGRLLSRGDFFRGAKIDRIRANDVRLIEASGEIRVIHVK